MSPEEVHLPKVLNPFMIAHERGFSPKDAAISRARGIRTPDATFLAILHIIFEMVWRAFKESMSIIEPTSM